MAKLLAIDLDGTLLRRDGTIDPRDASAIRRARDAGVTVTLATGRLTTGTLPVARALELDVPLVCADGATLCCAKTSEILERNAMALEHADAMLRALERHRLASFVFLHDAIHCDEAGVAHKIHVRGWSEQVHVHPSLERAEAWRAHGDVAMMLGIGDVEAAEQARAAIDASLGAHVVTSGFTVGERGVVRGFRVGCSKGTGVERVAARIGAARQDVAVIGDWWNDLPMFACAGRSFVMQGAPSAVRDAATDRLESRVGEGGGVAEAIAGWLG